MNATGKTGSRRPDWDPSRFIARWRSPGGTDVLIRPMRPSDVALEIEFLAGLSKDTLYQRSHSARGLLPGELKRLTRIDFDREMALLTTIGADSGAKAIAVARYVKNTDGIECEFAIVVADSWQRQGLGEKMLRTLVKIANAVGIRRVIGSTFATNEPMKSQSRKRGFSTRSDPADSTMTILSKTL
jgi:acetyltransferase